MFRLLKKLGGLSRSKKVILLEAYGRAAVALIMIRVLPYSFWRRWLGTPVSLSSVPLDIVQPNLEAGQELTDIVWAYGALSRHARYFTCLMLGFSARALCRRRGFPSVMVLGVERETKKAKLNLNAHAWVVHREFDIAGGAQRKGYTAVAAYSIN